MSYMARRHPELMPSLMIATLYLELKNERLLALCEYHFYDTPAEEKKMLEFMEKEIQEKNEPDGSKFHVMVIPAEEEE